MNNSSVEAEEGAEDSSLAKMLLTPEKAAELIIKAIEKNKYKVYIGKDSKFLKSLYKFAPKLAINLINKALQNK